MKIVRIMGGLGNQMFQFALYLSLRKKFPDEVVKIDLHGFNGYKLHNGFELNNIFKVDYLSASLTDVCSVAYPYPTFQIWRIGKRILPKRRTMCCETKNMIYDPTVLAHAGNRYFDGYWQNESYIKDVRNEILKIFAFPILTGHNLATAKRLLGNCSVSLHVRRGDYMKDPLFKGTCNLNYYQAAIDYMQNSVSPTLYCVFSDDVEWCRKHIQPMLNKTEVIYVDWNKGKESYRDMQLMSLCQHNIIANSSFSWWGAWLGKHSDKIVIAPKKWANIDNLNTPACSTWIKL
ncbi:MAG: alpha-1,2-fucosyltransferase [Prevotella sp.]|nr:alpha-1,2-fucosyltransferase [Prevotella sp.]